MGKIELWGNHGKLNFADLEQDFARLWEQQLGWLSLSNLGV